MIVNDPQQLLRWLDGNIDPQQINVVASGKQSSTSGLINITSYDLMARSIAELKQKNFRVVIMVSPSDVLFLPT